MTKKNFIEYLDNYKSVDYLDYNDIANIINLSNWHFYENSYYELSYSGKNIIQSDQPIPYYSLYADSKWNQSNVIDRSSELITDYDLWKRKHEMQLSFNELYSVYPLNVKSPKTKPKSKVMIDLSINDLSGFIEIINKYTYDENNEYNIDLKSITSIKDELIQLNNMIGMSTLKNSILDQLLYFIQELHITNNDSDFKHTVIYGPPGTGKTEIAKIIGMMYSKLGILKNNVFKKATRNDLIAGYLGQTAIKTKNLITSCLGGVLFIDEAYALANHYETDTYSKECIDTLCEALSDHKDDLMVIIAGYENDLNETFFKANQGMESRFIWRFKIDDYSSKELMNIFLKKVRETDWTFYKIEDINEKWFDAKKKTFQHFGRDMELLFSYTKIAHSRRIYGKEVELRKKISIDDMNKGYEMFMNNKKKVDQRFNKIMETLYV